MTGSVPRPWMVWPHVATSSRTGGSGVENQGLVSSAALEPGVKSRFCLCLTLDAALGCLHRQPAGNRPFKTHFFSACSWVLLRQASSTPDGLRTPKTQTPGWIWAKPWGRCLTQCTHHSAVLSASCLPKRTSRHEVLRLRGWPPGPAGKGEEGEQRTCLTERPAKNQPSSFGWRFKSCLEVCP